MNATEKRMGIVGEMVEYKGKMAGCIDADIQEGVEMAETMIEDGETAHRAWTTGVAYAERAKETRMNTGAQS